MPETKSGDGICHVVSQLGSLDGSHNVFKERKFSTVDGSFTVLLCWRKSSSLLYFSIDMACEIGIVRQIVCSLV